jgi:hypothetical protein
MRFACGRRTSRRPRSTDGHRTSTGTGSATFRQKAAKRCGAANKSGLNPRVWGRAAAFRRKCDAVDKNAPGIVLVIADNGRLADCLALTRLLRSICERFLPSKDM